MRMKTENLTKIYKSRVNKKENFYAAKDVNITLMEGKPSGCLETAAAENPH